MYGLEGLYSDLTFGHQHISVQLSFVDCTQIQTRSQLQETICRWSTDSSRVRIFYFDEVHRLVKYNMDEMLLKAIEEKRALWFFSTAKPEGLEDMFKGRLIKADTEAPTDKELAEWLTARCDEWHIRWEPEAIVRVVEKSERIPGSALFWRRGPSRQEQRVEELLSNNRKGGFANCGNRTGTSLIVDMQAAHPRSWQKEFTREEIHLDFAALTPVVVDYPSADPSPSNAIACFLDSFRRIARLALARSVAIA